MTLLERIFLHFKIENTEDQLFIQDAMNTFIFAVHNAYNRQGDVLNPFIHQTHDSTDIESDILPAFHTFEEYLSLLFKRFCDKINNTNTQLECNFERSLSDEALSFIENLQKCRFLSASVKENLAIIANPKNPSYSELGSRAIQHLVEIGSSFNYFVSNIVKIIEAISVLKLAISDAENFNLNGMIKYLENIIIQELLRVKIKPENITSESLSQIQKAIELLKYLSTNTRQQIDTSVIQNCGQILQSILMKECPPNQPLQKLIDEYLQVSTKRSFKQRLIEKTQIHKSEIVFIMMSLIQIGMKADFDAHDITFFDILTNIPELHNASEQTRQKTALKLLNTESVVLEILNWSVHFTCKTEHESYIYTCREVVPIKQPC